MFEIELDYGALSIDTNVFDRHNIAIETGLFKQMHQFSNSPVKIIFSDVIHGEVRKHLLEKLKDAREKIEHALKKGSNAQLFPGELAIESARKLLVRDDSDSDIAEKRLQAFYASTNAEIIESAKYADVSRLIQMYFDCLAPFENSGDKKNEFPDALALIGIEAWAKQNSKKVLVVSRDKGWKNYADTSEWIDVIEDLGNAITLFQPHNAAKNVIAGLQKAILDEKKTQVLDTIVDEIKNNLDGADIQVHATSDLFFEEDELFATYIKHEFVKNEFGVPQIDPIRISEDDIVLMLTALVTCDVQCSFALSVWDSIDKEYVSISSTTVSQELEYETPILVALTGDFSKGFEGLESDEVDIVDNALYVDFGDIKPDYGD